MMKKAIFLTPPALFLIILVACFLAWRWWQGALQSPSATDAQKIFVIQEGEAIQSVGQRLYKEGLIKSPTAFRLYLRFSGVGQKIQAGDFRLRPNMPLTDLVRELQHGQLDIWVTLIEGWRVEEFAEEVERVFGLSPSDFQLVSEEGYMFPDTYLFPRDVSAATIAARLKAEFETRLSVKMREVLRAQGRTVEDVVILASLVEREAHKDPDRAIVAGILQNRLALRMPLQVDATVQYALGYQDQEQKSPWWKQDLTTDDLQVDSPYNTYRHIGLPPAPICNPGLSALTAAVYPQETDYLYYIHDRDGNIYYATTNEEHEVNKNKIGI
ncbi:MAG: endolytic transglycosylase MltG [bacterium]|nr:endolytic transglycosylase MltG [bacterium]